MTRKRISLFVTLIAAILAAAWLYGFFRPHDGYLRVVKAHPDSRRLHVLASWDTCQTGKATMKEHPDRIVITVTRRNEWCHIWGPQSGLGRSYRWTLSQRLGMRPIIEARTGDPSPGEYPRFNKDDIDRVRPTD